MKKFKSFTKEFDLKDFEEDKAFDCINEKTPNTADANERYKLNNAAHLQTSI